MESGINIACKNCARNAYCSICIELQWVVQNQVVSIGADCELRCHLLGILLHSMAAGDLRLVDRQMDICRYFMAVLSHGL